MAYRKGQGGALSPATRITQEIIARLESGTRPWIKPWRGVPVSRPLRACGIPYRGMNVFWLWMVADMCGYASPYWMTYNQAKSLGAQVKKGEKSTIAIFLIPSFRYIVRAYAAPIATLFNKQNPCDPPSGSFGHRTIPRGPA